jgi:dolichol-phosphate mannosyltransferase
MKKVSIVVPVYQNELNIQQAFSEIKQELSAISGMLDYEIIFVDDGSRDNSFNELIKCQNLDKQHVSIVKLTRNFGQVSACMAGIKQANGDCVLIISADSQEPAYLIPIMLKEWEGGHKVVIAVRESREDGIFRKFTSYIFYNLMRKYSVSNMPVGGFDCFVIDKEIGKMLTDMKESNRFLQGQILWVGYPPKIIYYKRKKRELGKTQWSILKKVKYFIDGFVSYSFFPIRLISNIGLVMFFIGIFVTFILVFQRILYGTKMVGWSSIMITIIVLNGFQLMMLGIIGEYLWRNLDETRSRPLYIIEKIIK